MWKNTVGLWSLNKQISYIFDENKVININKYIKFSKASNHNGLKSLNSFNAGVHFVYEHFWQLIVWQGHMIRDLPQTTYSRVINNYTETMSVGN